MVHLPTLVYKYVPGMVRMILSFTNLLVMDIPTSCVSSTAAPPSCVDVALCCVSVPPRSVASRNLGTHNQCQTKCQTTIDTADQQPWQCSLSFLFFSRCLSSLYQIGVVVIVIVAERNIGCFGRQQTRHGLW